MIDLLLQCATINVNMLTHIRHVCSGDGRHAAIHHAVICDQNATLDRLLRVGGIDVNLPGSDGEPPLLLAIRRNNLFVVTKLIQDDRTTIQWPHTSISALSHAIVQGHLGVFDRILSSRNAGSVLNIPSSMGVTPLMIAAQYKEIEMVKRLLATETLNVGIAPQRLSGFSPLELALQVSRDDRYQSMVLLIKDGRVYVNAPMAMPDPFGKTLLHHLVQIDDAAAIGALHILLRRSDINVNATNMNGDTPIHTAVKHSMGGAMPHPPLVF